MTDGDSEEAMDQRRKAAADKIITQMVLDKKDGQSIAKQKEANRQAFGHEGEANVEQH